MAVGQRDPDEPFVVAVAGELVVAYTMLAPEQQLLDHLVDEPAVSWRDRQASASVVVLVEEWQLPVALAGPEQISKRRLPAEMVEEEPGLRVLCPGQR